MIGQSGPFGMTLERGSAECHAQVIRHLSGGHLARRSFDHGFFKIFGMRIDESDPLPEEPPGEMAAFSSIH